MVSIRSLLNCIGVDTGQNVSILGHFFGFFRMRVPTDPDVTVSAEVSLLEQSRALQGKHIHLNIIRVGYDLVINPTTNNQARDEIVEKIDYAIYRAREIYEQVNLGIGRVQHYDIPSSLSKGLFDLGSKGEACELWESFTAKSNGIDAFIVHSISSPAPDDFVGRSPRGGSCFKSDVKDSGLVAGAMDRDFNPLIRQFTYHPFARTFAHEIGHFLGEAHNHDDDSCPSGALNCNNLMAQTGCATGGYAYSTCSSNTRDAVLLTSGQGVTMRDHCTVKDGC